MSDLKQILAELVAFDTVSSNSNLACARYVSDRLTTLGISSQLDVEMVDGVEKVNVVAVIGPNIEGGLLVSGHLDVVPHQGQPGWTSNPLDLTSDGDRVVGRGVADMKGFVAACLYSLAGFDFDKFCRPLILAFTCDEEVGCAGSGRLIERLPGLLNGCPLPGFGWIGEPTDFRAMVAHKGYFQFDVTVNTPGGHSSKPALGVNSIEVAADIIREFAVLGANWKREAGNRGPDLFDGAGTDSLNVALVTGGLAMNMIPEECRLRVSGRSLPDSNQADLLHQVEEAVKRAAVSWQEGNDAVRVRVHGSELTPALSSPRESPLLSLLQSFSNEPVGYASYATDGGHFAALGIKSYICGPGELEQAHQPNESVREADLLRCSDMVARVCMEFLVD